MNIVLLGPQGSGKGTQAQLIAKHFGFNHLSPGDLIRRGVAGKDPHAMKVKALADAGKLISTKDLLLLLKSHLKKDNIFDGVPREIHQAESMDQIAEVDLVIALDLDDDTAVKRIAGRKTCPECGTVYGDADPPKKKGVCDLDGKKLVIRDDDTPDGVKKRLATYREKTEPLLEYYKPRNIVHHVNAAQEISEIFDEIKTIIEQHSV